MGLSSSMPLSSEEMSNICKETGFSKALVLRLYLRFKILDRRSAGCLEQEDFLKVGHFHKNPFRDRILQLFFEENNETLTGVTFPKFLKTLAAFRPAVENKTPPDQPNSRESKTKVMFRMLDVDKDGKISRFELFDAVKSMIHVNISEEELCSIVERAILEVDEDEDGMVSYEEFVQMVQHIPIEEKFSLRFLLT
ncbi:hypothetical protein HELRODRAFT_185098 [Helobdella robusta]|uniref:EF-hand domain-containing protein n=1 Tax=Helobdella robusta TaxID=6412 RepID=T1FME3_HELRO|nr:hypothetical protein HELRODRAFT_185098 [Helobdella robusta]ESN94152.1 hypothetical protein HELRODRAFT_185098 [Helobdella robusta]